MKTEGANPTTNRHRFGLSVSLCIIGIMSGDVLEEDVEVIFAGFACTTTDEWQTLINNYRRTYWRENPDLGEEILRRFLAADKIKCPVLREGGDPIYPMSPIGQDDCWAATLGEIRFA